MAATLAMTPAEATPLGVAECRRRHCRDGECCRPRRLKHRRRDLALDHAAGRLGDAEYMAAVAVLRAAEEEAPAPELRSTRQLLCAVRDFGALWASRSEAQRGEMLREVYARIEVKGPEFVAAYLTPDAAELGLTVALPETVSVAMASPAGFEPATGGLEDRCSVL